MRTRILLFCGIMLALCLWLLLHRTTKQTISDSREVQTMLTNQAARTEQAKAVENRQAPNTSKTTTTPPIAVPHTLTPGDSNAMAAEWLARWQVPIDFYGKVVDENTNQVAGAKISFQWVETPTEDGTRTFTTYSDMEGLFSLNDKRGPSLEVWVSKEGYYASHGGQKGFSYGWLEGFKPDPQNPIVLNLRKNGTPESLVHIAGIGLHTMRDFLLTADGKPTEVSLRDGRLASTGQGDLRVEFKAGQPIDGSPSKITWDCQVTIPGGGLIQTSEEFPFLAPEGGYKESDAWSVVSTNWTESMNKQYYVKLRDGNF